MSQHEKEKIKNELLKGEEVAEIFKVSLRTVIRWAKADHIHPIRIGNTTRYRRSEIEGMMNPGVEK